jgi:Prealbumin-like fold domain
MSVLGMHGDGARPPGRKSHRFLTSRRSWKILLTVAAASVLAIGIAIPAKAVLSGSPSQFEANDGNMTVEGGAGFNDWNSVQGSPNYVHLSDKFSTTQDDSFQSGQKQDSVCPVINTNKNPPKDDFTDVASFNETNLTSGHTYLDGATIRVAANGNASENVELNKGTNGLCAGTTDQLARSAGDKLIAIDYLNGGTNVQFHVLTWVTSGTCFVSKDTAPCWGSTVESLSQNSAEGLVNQSPIAAADNKINNLALVTGQFAEFGVDLTAAGIVPANACTAFPQTLWESRASGSSFVSSTEDVSVERHTISNCGTLIIKKVTEPSPDPTNTSFDFTAGGGLTPTGFSLKNGDTQTYNDVFAGSGYSAAETVPANWDLTSASCDNGSGTLGNDTLSGISVSPGETVTCTFHDKLRTGAIQVTKTYKHAASGPGDHPQSGVSFTVNGVTKQTDANGQACFDGLAMGTYTVHETVPAGYHVDANDKQVTVDNTATCSDNPYGGETVSFHNTPLTDITTVVDSQVDGGTSSTIACTDAGNNTVASGTTGASGDGSATASNLEPGTYTCTVVIDP